MLRWSNQVTDCQEQDGHCPNTTSSRGEPCHGCITIDALADDDDDDYGVDEDDDDSLDDPNEDEGGEEIDASFLNHCAPH